MTLRDVYEYALIECNKNKVSSLLLETFNYLWRKAEIQYANKCYNLCEINQQLTDNLRMLKDDATANLEHVDGKGIYSHIYEAIFNIDYFHLLNCIIEYKVTSPFKCYNVNDYIQVNANKMTSNIWGTINQNYYTRPKYTNPYYFINNSNSNSAEVLISETSESEFISDLGDLDNLESELNSNNLVNNLRLELRIGSLPSQLEVSKVYIDYLKHPKKIVLTQEQIDLIEDSSPTVDYPDYICYEIINELVKLILENNGDPRLQTNIPVNQSISTQLTNKN